MKTRPRQLWLDCLILAIPFRSHILFKSRALCLSLLSQNRRLSISLLSILQPLLKPALPSYTIFFISLPPSPPPPIHNILWASSPELCEILQYTYLFKYVFLLFYSFVHLLIALLYGSVCRFIFYTHCYCTDPGLQL